MSCEASFSDQFRRAADLVDKILHGVKPADIPVEQPTKFDHVINLKMVSNPPVASIAITRGVSAASLVASSPMPAPLR